MKQISSSMQEVFLKQRQDFMHFIQDIIGLCVRDADTGKEYGTVKDVLQTGANDVYEINNGEKTYLIPAIEQVIIKTDIENSEMLIRPLEGLFDED